MPAVTNEVVAILQALLPGFLAAWIFYGLTAHPKPREFERTVQALVFTVIVQIITAGLREVLLFAGTYYAIGTWTQDVHLFWALIAGTLLGVLFAGFANNDTVHGWLRCRDWKFRKDHSQADAAGWRWTHQTSYPSEWFGAFSENDCYVVLHLSGNRRLYGFPAEWPNQPGEGCFVMTLAEWLLEDNTRVPLKQICSVLIPAKDVEFVEIVAYAGAPSISEAPGGNDDSKSSPTAADSP